MSGHASFRIATLFITLVFCASSQARPIKFARFPHISHGKIAFTYHGDIWVVNEDGSNPVQLTDHEARDEYPRFSPDGKYIAFTSSRMGNNDIWVIPSGGGTARQLTFHSTNDRALYWTPDGRRIIFATSRGAMMWGSPLYTVSVEGGLPEPMEMGMGAAGMMSQDGRMLAFNRVGYRHPKKHYRGSAAANVWVKDLRANTFTKLTNIELEEYKQHAHDAYPMWGADGQIYFMSDRDGTFNIWRISPKGGKPSQVTTHTIDGVQFPAISPDGKSMVYSNEFELWKLDVPRGKPKKITIEIPYRPEANLVEHLTTENRADGFHPSPEGKFLAVDYHGEIFLVPSESGVGEKRQITRSEWRERAQHYSPDGKHLVYLSDESGEDELWLCELETGDRRILSRQPDKKQIRAWSPDSRVITYSIGNTMYSIDITTGDAAQMTHNDAGGIQSPKFSPDGKWLVYSRSDDYQNSDVYLFNIAEKKEYNITEHPARDTDGWITPDQKTVVFTSNRGDGVSQVYRVSLDRIGEDPDDPLVKLKRSDQGPARRGAPDPQPIAVDLEDIDRRCVQITGGSESVGTTFLSANGRTIYYTIGGGRQPRARRPQAQPGAAARPRGSLNSIGIDGENQRQIAAGSFPSLTPTQDRRMVFFQRPDGIYKLNLGGRGAGSRASASSGAAAGARARPQSAQAQRGPSQASSGSGEKVEFSFTVFVDKRKEWKQMFDEFYRHWKYSYVEEDMHGFDWDAIKARYEPVVEHIGETRDFWDLAAEMLAELNSSHSGASPPRPPQPPKPPYQTRLPGFELAPDNGKYKVSHIYRDGPADKEWIDLKVGDYVLAIDGHEIKAGDNYWKILNGLLNEYVNVTVSSSPDAAGGTREIRVKTVTSLRNIKYEEWVAKNREYVDKESNGQIVYLHIRAMNQASLAKFEQEIDQFFYKKGIICDVRFNGGGNIDQQLMDILERKPYQYTWTKTGSPVWGRRPKQTIVGPKVMLTNWRSGSDAEMTPHGFRHLGLGRLLGTPTNGAVVSAGRYSLLDGGSIRIPRTRVVSFDPTKPHNFGFNLENYGVPPDIWVRNSPEDEIRGHDRVLKTAVDEVLKMLRQGTWQWSPTEQNGKP
jgi:tricorn protease